jgi:hypothetical protein
VHGGLRWLVVENDFVIFSRESKEQHIIVFVSRKEVDVDINLESFGFTVLKTLYGIEQKGNKLKFTSEHSAQAIWIVQ